MGRYTLGLDFPSVNELYPSPPRCADEMKSISRGPRKSEFYLLAAQSLTNGVATYPFNLSQLRVSH